MIILDKPWRRELFALIVAAATLVLLGIWVGYPLEVLVVGAVCYLGWQLAQLFRLNLWLESPKHHKPPVAVGVWRSVLNAVEQLRERGRKRKRKLERMLRGFQESTSALPDATIVLNDRGEAEWWNSVATGMLGFERKKDQGRRIDELISDPVFRSYLAQGDYGRPLKMPAPVNDSVNLEIRIVPYSKGKRLLQARDISRLQQLETVRRDFVANVSHEMRTPLTVIHGYLESMCESKKGSLKDWEHVVDQMRQQTDRMQHIVEDLLLLSRLESNEQTKGQTAVDAPGLLESIRSEAISLSGGGHRIELEADHSIWIYGNGRELESAFSNLVFNAVRYTPEGGRIVLRWWGDEEGAHFQVRDSGPGIESKHIPRLTERFYRVDVGRSRRSGGTGLGLAIVKHVVTCHGGRLKIESELGKGSAFTCCFPASLARRMEQLEDRRMAAPAVG